MENTLNIIEQANTAGWAQELVHACLEAPAGRQLEGNTRFKLILSAKAVFGAVLEALPEAFSALSSRSASEISDLIRPLMEHRVAAGCRVLLMRAHDFLQFLARPVEAAAAAGSGPQQAAAAAGSGPQQAAAAAQPRGRGSSSSGGGRGGGGGGGGGGATVREQQLAVSMLLPAATVEQFVRVMQRYMLAPRTHLQG